MQITERLEVSVAYITAKGIKFNDLYYTNGKMIQLGWFERALKKGEWKVNVIKLKRRANNHEKEQVIQKITRSFFCTKKKNKT